MSTISPLPTPRADEHVAPEPSQGETTSDALAKAAQEVVDEKIVKAATPKPRRVGPLRKIHLASFAQNAKVIQPDVEEIARLQGEIRQLRRKAAQATAATFDDVLEDLGHKREAEENARIVEEGGESWIELERVATRPAAPSQGPLRRG